MCENERETKLWEGLRQRGGREGKTKRQKKRFDLHIVELL